MGNCNQTQLQTALMTREHDTTTRCPLLLNKGLVAWTGHRQQCITLSTSEAEHVVACQAPEETVDSKPLESHRSKNT